MAEFEEKACDLEGCEETFVPRVHNQRFHSRECCRVFTNQRILDAYHEKKNRDMKNRRCAVKTCNTILSIYNEDKICATHQELRHKKKLRDWGWRIDSEDS